MSVTLNQDSPEFFTVTIGMRNSERVNLEGAAPTVGAVIKAAVNQLGSSNDETQIFSGDSFLQSVFVNGERVTNANEVIPAGSRVMVDQRKKNG